MRAEHAQATDADRTAMSLEEWREGEITQAAVAWVLGCVFVRFLEDNGLIDQPLLSGPASARAAALGHRDEYFRAHPQHSDREYLEACFREVAALPRGRAAVRRAAQPALAARPDRRRRPALRETFWTAIDPGQRRARSTTSPTRTLGHALPRRPLPGPLRGGQEALRAAADAGLRRGVHPRPHARPRRSTSSASSEVRLIDPTCGSGHFLIGAFERLFALWQEREPGTTATVLAQRCLDQIARRRPQPVRDRDRALPAVVAALQACGISRLAEAPAFTLHLATGDSLLHGPLPTDGATMLFDGSRDRTENIAHVFETEDAAELKRILGRGYHAVVGNPPYIAVQDSALRDAYRARYASCHGQVRADRAVHGAVLRTRQVSRARTAQRRRASSARSPATAS